VIFGGDSIVIPEQKASVTVGKAAALVGLSKPMLYAAIKEGSLKAWRPWARGDLRINLDELDRWSGKSDSAAA
jgi:excisionase family DNA binding protein